MNIMSILLSAADLVAAAAGVVDAHCSTRPLT
jgi:hypothetical protein